MRFPWKYATSFILVAASALCLAAPTHAGDAPLLERMKKEYRRPAAIPFPDDNPFSVDKDASKNNLNILSGFLTFRV